MNAKNAKNVIKIDADHPDILTIQVIVERLRRGEVGVIPTETVYGLAAMMSAPKAVERLYFMKGREKSKPCAVAIWEKEQVRALTPEVTASAEMLIEELWPGPLTLVFRAGEGIPEYVSRGLSTIGVRCPDHAVPVSVMRVLGEPLVLTSANRSGEASPFSAERIDLDEWDFIVDAGETPLRRESTVVDVTQDPATVLRRGVIEEDRLREFGVFS